MLQNEKKKKIITSQWLQFLGVFLLMGFTIYGIFTFHQENWSRFFEILYNKRNIFILILALRIADWILDYGVWRYVLHLYGISLPLINSILVYMTQGAGILLPVQLGRVVRGYVLSKKFNFPGELCLVVEGHMLIVVFSGAFLTFLFFLGEYANMKILIWTMGFGIFSLVWIFMKYGSEFFSNWFSKIPRVNTGYMVYLVLSVLCGIGWFINGLIFYCLLKGNNSELSLAEAQLVLLGGIFLGAISGIPGGLGILEAVLGVSLYWLKVDTPEIIIIVGVFRLITYWFWIPLGWVALLMLGFKKIHANFRGEMG